MLVAQQDWLTAARRPYCRPGSKAAHALLQAKQHAGPGARPQTRPCFLWPSQDIAAELDDLEAALGIGGRASPAPRHSRQASQGAASTARASGSGLPRQGSPAARTQHASPGRHREQTPPQQDSGKASGQGQSRTGNESPSVVSRHGVRLSPLPSPQPPSTQATTPQASTTRASTQLPELSPTRRAASPNAAHSPRRDLAVGLPGTGATTLQAQAATDIAGTDAWAARSEQVQSYALQRMTLDSTGTIDSAASSAQPSAGGAAPAATERPGASILAAALARGRVHSSTGAVPGSTQSNTGSTAGAADPQQLHSHALSTRSTRLSSGGSWAVAAPDVGLETDAARYSPLQSHALLLDSRTSRSSIGTIASEHTLSAFVTGAPIGPVGARLSGAGAAGDSGTNTEGGDDNNSSTDRAPGALTTRRGSAAGGRASDTLLPVLSDIREEDITAHNTPRNGRSLETVRHEQSRELESHAVAVDAWQAASRDASTRGGAAGSAGGGAPAIAPTIPPTTTASVLDSLLYMRQELQQRQQVLSQGASDGTAASAGGHSPNTASGGRAVSGGRSGGRARETDDSVGDGNTDGLSTPPESPHRCVCVCMCVRVLCLCTCTHVCHTHALSHITCIFAVCTLSVIVRVSMRAA